MIHPQNSKLGVRYKYGKHRDELNVPQCLNAERNNAY